MLPWLLGQRSQSRLINIHFSSAQCTVRLKQNCQSFTNSSFDHYLSTTNFSVLQRLSFLILKKQYSQHRFFANSQDLPKILYVKFGKPISYILQSFENFKKMKKKPKNLKALTSVVCLVWKQSTWKTKLFKNDEDTIMWYPCPNFPQTQIQNDWWS